MIDITRCIWLTAGLAAGLLHATMLWRAAHRPTAWTPLLGLVRLAAVAAVLTAAALRGEVLTAAAGWAVGFAALGAWLLLHRAGRTNRPTRVHPGD